MVIIPIEKTCPKCGGTGKKKHINLCEPYNDDCPRCEGSGKIEVLPRNIPRGPSLCCNLWME